MRLIHQFALLVSITVSPPQINARISCSTTNDCEEKLTGGSECVDGFCTNPYTKGGCLSRMLPEWNQLRVCTSDDILPEAADRGHCRLQNPEMDYMEIRIISQNWESSFFESWVQQILLTELVGVPATIETGSPNADVNFYHPESALSYGRANDFDALRTAARVKDCRTLRQQNADSANEDYISCGHVLMELWMDVHIQLVRPLQVESIVETPQSLGGLGVQTWFLPKFTVERDPTLLSYFGMVGLENRRKLAETFLRPTAWKDYCELVSSNNCSTPDGVAMRAPEDEIENDRMFVEGIYTGHFRKTEKNDCDKWPLNCTGHIADYPCGWTSFVKPQTHYLGIALESDGNTLNCGGYTYTQLIEMWAAANATKSNLIGLWWTPELLYAQFSNSESELLKVTLPTATQDCIENRITSHDRASNDTATQLGEEIGACEDSSQILQKLISSSLAESINDPAVPETRRSPGYQIVKNFRISQYHVGKFFEYWLSKGQDKWNHDPREATCEWVVENIDYLKDLIPPTFPRVLKKNSHFGVLFYVGTVLGTVSTLAVVLTMIATFVMQKRKPIRAAQIEFLFLLLVGLLFVAVGAIVKAIPPSDTACIFAMWLVYLGYTMELVPLIVKVAAINRLMSSARKLRRVVVNRSTLFVAVAILNSLMVACLIPWTTVDPPRRQVEDELSNEMTEDGETIVKISYHCDSENDGWVYAALSWNVLLLVVATVLAFQSRNVRQEFNESQTLATMIYSHFVFLVLRLVTFLLKHRRELNESALTSIRSLILSADVIATICIYFVPKFFAKTKRRPSASRFSLGSTAGSDPGFHSSLPFGDDDLKLFAGGRQRRNSGHNNSSSSLPWDQSLNQIVQSMRRGSFRVKDRDGRGGGGASVASMGLQGLVHDNDDGGSCRSGNSGGDGSFTIDATPLTLRRQHSDGLEEQPNATVSFADTTSFLNEGSSKRTRQNSSRLSMNSSSLVLDESSKPTQDGGLNGSHEEYITKLSS